MRYRAVRLIVVVLLLSVGAGAAAVAWGVERNEPVAAAAQRDLDHRLDLLAATIGDISAAQTAYVAPGQDPASALERFPHLLRQASTGTAEIGPVLRAADGRHVLQTFADAISRLAQADALARDSLLFGDTQAAAHVILGEAREAIAAMSTALGTLRAVEMSARAGERASAIRRAWMMVAGAGLLWTVGLLALAPLSSNRRSTVDAGRPVDTGAGAPDTLTPDARHADAMIAAAELCTAISRVDTTAALPTLLARAAALLDAPGIIVWVGVGDELFAVASHGYSATTMSRLGAISRDAANATAAAWRQGVFQVVPGDATSHGAITAPLFGPDGCIGVFAVELPQGSEADAVTRATAVMIAAQLAAIVAGWPGTQEAPVAEAATRSPLLDAG